MLSQLLLLDPEQLLELISAKILLMLAPEQRGEGGLGEPLGALVLSSPCSQGLVRLPPARHAGAVVLLHSGAAASGLEGLWYLSASAFVPGFASLSLDRPKWYPLGLETMSRSSGQRWSNVTLLTVSRVAVGSLLGSVTERSAS